MDSSQTTQPENHIKAKPEISVGSGGPDFEYAAGSETPGGKYKIIEKLGGGGMSVVYRCTDAKGREVAVKFLKAQLAGEAKWLNRFKQEAKAISRLKHPNIIGIHEFSFESKPPFIVMEFAKGTSFADLVTFEGAIEPKRAMRLMLMVADALQHAHNNGVVHRDLKPSNIMLVDQNGSESAKILDFGIAKINEPENPDIKMTQTGEIFGSPAYMSPEQSLGKKVDERADQYAFGCVLFECLTGGPPFMGDNAVDTLMRQIHYKPPSLKEASLGQAFSPELEKFVARTLEKEPAQRYSSMVEVKKQLEEIINPPNSFSKAVREAKKADWKLIRLGVLIGLLFGLFCGAISAYSIWLFKAPTAKEMKPNEAKKLDDGHRPEDEGSADEKFIAYVKQNPYTAALDVSGEALGDKGLAAIASLKNLTRLRADRCKNISDDGVAALRNAKNLHQLSISENAAITDASAEALKNLPLTDLSLARTTVSNKGLVALSNIRSLRRLDVSGTPIGDLGVMAISTLPLEALSLSTTHFVTNHGFEALANTKTLHYLALDTNPLLGPCLPKLSGLDLYQITLSQTAVRDSDLNYLLPMKHLVSLDLTQTGITDDGLKTIGTISTLKKLKLRFAIAVTKNGLIELQKKLPGCLIVYVPSIREHVSQAESTMIKVLDRDAGN